jgi:hypothetical protein
MVQWRISSPLNDAVSGAALDIEQDSIPYLIQNPYHNQCIDFKGEGKTGLFQLRNGNVGDMYKVIRK